MRVLNCIAYCRLASCTHDSCCTYGYVAGAAPGFMTSCYFAYNALLWVSLWISSYMFDWFCNINTYITDRPSVPV